MNAIEVTDGAGEVVFFIQCPSGVCFKPHHGEVDPRRLATTWGQSILYQVAERRGLNGEKITYFSVDGGDTIRLVELSTENDCLYRKLFPVFGDRWWEPCSLKGGAA